MTTIPRTFDPAAYKTATTAQWEAAADSWNSWGPTIERWLGPATDVMLDLGGVAAGGHVLDVAAGAGGQTLAAARRAGSAGAVLATDIAPTILRYAERAARDAGLHNVLTRVMDAEHIDVDPATFDAVISRVGLIYCPDQQAALGGMRGALGPGGRVAAIVYSTPDRNGFFSVPVGDHPPAGQLPPPAPGQPGPFSLGGEGVLADAMTDGRLSRRRGQDRPGAACGSRARAECVRFERESFGALHQMLTGLDADAQAAAWAEIARELEPVRGPRRMRRRV